MCPAQLQCQLNVISGGSKKGGAHRGVCHTCQVLRFRRSHYGFLEKLKTTAVVRNYYGFTLGWGCHFCGNHLIMFGLFLDELMGLSQYC